MHGQRAALITALANCVTSPTLVNPFAEISSEHDLTGAAAIRHTNLDAYLAARSRPIALLVGEAMGWRGGRFSGIAFTSERQLRGWGLPYAASSHNPAGWAESSATIIHSVLNEFDLELQVALWNTVPFHPHPPGQPLANRAPRRDEVALGLPLLDQAIALLRPQQIVAIGRVAERTLGDRATTSVRHPSHGGASACRDGLRRLLAN